MKMHKEEYEKLMIRFATELAEVGVPNGLIERVKSSLERTPNLISCQDNQIVEYFQYKHSGYMIQAKKTVELTVKKCK